MPRKSFEVRSGETQEQIEFSIVGKMHIEEGDTITEKEVVEDFVCISAMPGGALARFIKDAMGAQALPAVVAVIESVIADQDLPRFRAMLESKDIIISFDVLADVCNWLVEEFAARPTKPPSASARGRSVGGVISKADTTSPAATDLSPDSA